MIDIVDASTPREIEAVRALTREYAALPHIEGRWARPESDIRDLPGPYVPPRGGLLLALVSGSPVGSVAFQPLSEEVVELKRLYVRPAGRRLGVASALVAAVIDRSRAAGYALLRLDTAPELTAARVLYERLGFREIPPYHADYPDPLCFELDLRVGEP